MFRSLVIVLAIAVATPAVGEETKEIPLKDIWAYKMPGTKEMTDAQREGKYVADEGAVVWDIRRALKYRRDKVAGPAFVVNGEGRDVLPKVLEVLRGYQTEEKKDDPKPLEAGEKVTLVFFAYQSGLYVQLVKVEMKDKAITVRYRFVRHETLNLSEHIALIPLGELKPGKYSVDIQRYVESKDEVLEGDEGRIKRIDSQPFTFEVIPKEQEETNGVQCHKFQR